MADKRLKSMIRSTEIKDVLGNYGFTKNDVVEGVALAAAAVLTDKEGFIRTVDVNGNPSVVRMETLIREPDGSSYNTAVKVRSIKTKNKPIGTRIVTEHFGPGGNIMELQAVTNSDNGTTAIRPDDYDVSANKKVWIAADVTGGTVYGSFLKAGSTGISTSGSCQLSGGGQFQGSWTFYSGYGSLQLPTNTYASYLPQGSPAYSGSYTLYVDYSGFVKRG